MNDGDAMTWEEMYDAGYTFGPEQVSYKDDGTIVIKRQLIDPDGKPVVITDNRPHTMGVITGIVE